MSARGYSSISSPIDSASIGSLPGQTQDCRPTDGIVRVTPIAMTVPGVGGRGQSSDQLIAASIRHVDSSALQATCHLGFQPWLVHIASRVQPR